MPEAERAVANCDFRGKQRCWVHKTANLLSKVALSVQANKKKELREAYSAPNRLRPKWRSTSSRELSSQARQGSRLDRETLLCDFPAEH
jgi:transposase-like protein